MISKLLALLRNRASSPEEIRLENALRSEAARLRANEEEDEVAVASIVKHAKRRPRIREAPTEFQWLPSRALLGGAVLLAVILLALKFGNQPNPDQDEPQQAQQMNPAAKALFAEPVKTLTEPFAPLVFNPLEPVADEWNRFAGDTRAKAESLLATAKSWTTLPAPPLSIDPDSFLPELPELNEFSPYGNELQRLRNDALNAFEALPFVPKRRG
ncbi:MAG: hypothetical protein VCA36_11235 [Opitutales bacterium]